MPVHDMTVGEFARIVEAAGPRGVRIGDFVATFHGSFRIDADGRWESERTPIFDSLAEQYTRTPLFDRLAPRWMRRRIPRPRWLM